MSDANAPSTVPGQMKDSRQCTLDDHLMLLIKDMWTTLLLTFLKDAVRVSFVLLGPSLCFEREFPTALLQIRHSNISQTTA